jgi:23S rRNA (uracil1939-C5)-methyltransferase
MVERDLLITRVGAQGDGIADANGIQVYVPFALPGERVTAEVSGERGRLLQVLEASAERVAPVCSHFSKCGGCSAQHMAHDIYRNWKRDLVVAAFRARGLDVDVAPLIATGGKRRRAVLSAEHVDGCVAIGFHESSSHNVVAIHECPVLEPKIIAALPGLADLVASLLSKHGELRLTVTLTRSGLAVEIDGSERRLSPELRTRLAAAASDLQLARLTVGGEIVCETKPPYLTFGTAEAGLPAGVFVQAVAEAEVEIAGRIVAAIGKSKAVADLFCGMGAFTFPLAACARVSAFDSQHEAIAALLGAATKATGLKPITARVRDLFREPLSPLELNEHDAIVFDPPRTGSDAQAKMLAKSKVKTVIAASCNAATLARDARHLVDGGYRIESVTPIDQFVYSAHVEVVTIFRR